MPKVYINYPNPHITIHADSGCPSIQQHRKPGQRIVELNIETLSAELKHFETKDYQFTANRELNDMWLDVEFADPAFERAIIEYVRRLLARHYIPFARCEVDEHC